jgi:DNA recombination protein RmuC
MLTAVIILGILVLVLLGVVIWQLRRPAEKPDTNSALLLKADMTELNKNVTQLKEGLQKQLSDQLGQNSKHVAAQLSESSKMIREVTTKLTELDKTNKNVGDIAGELKTLQNVLQNPKQRGGIGEIYLESVLENVLPPGVFQMQYAFKNGEAVDAAIFLDQKILPVDSKFSLENYNRLVEENDKTRREALVTVFKNDVKKRIDETAKYIRPKENTTDFAFMFIPSEAIYYDLLINKVGVSKTSSRNLIEYAYQTRKVIIVSPTTMLAYLQAVAQGLRSMEIGEQAKEIIVRVGELSRHLGKHEELMHKLGGSLGTSVNHFNNAHKEFKKIDKDIVKIAGTTSGVEPLLLDKPQLGED